MQPYARLALSCSLGMAACNNDSGTAATDAATDAGTTNADTAAASTDDGEPTTADPGTSGPDPGSSGDGSTSSTDDGSADHGDDGDPELPYDPDQLDRVCDRGNGDPIAIRLCSDPSITSLAELYQALDMVIEPASFALLANSTSLAARSVSAINPRVLLRVQPGAGTGVDLGATAFSRGEQVVELFGYDEANDSLNFYLLTFFQGCNDAPGGCSTAERYTPAVESGWTKWSLYQDIDLENHPLDCLTCHQPAGPGSEKLLLMQQAVDPWMHWFPGISIGTGGETTSATLLTPLFLEMHGDEAEFGGIPIAMVAPPAATASGIVMNQMLEIYWSIKGGVPASLTPLGQEHPFDSVAIEADVAADSTATWDAYFVDSLAGLRLPPPHHRHDITDAAKRAAVVASHQAVLSGAAEPDTMLDPRDVLATETEVELGFRPRPEATASEILHHVCQRCHNDRLDQSLSRARFNAEHLEALTAEQKTAAIERLMRPEHAAGHMPPSRFATLPEDSLQTLLDFLEE